MNSNQSLLARDAKAIYERMKLQLEASHANELLAIEPISGDFFLGATLSDAIGASRRQRPDRLAHAFRIGHRAAVHFGLHIQCMVRG